MSECEGQRTVPRHSAEIRQLQAGVALLEIRITSGRRPCFMLSAFCDDFCPFFAVPLVAGAAVQISEAQTFGVCRCARDSESERGRERERVASEAGEAGAVPRRRPGGCLRRRKTQTPCIASR